MRKDWREIEDLKCMLTWAKEQNLFLDTHMVLHFFGFDNQKLFSLLGRIDDQLASRILGEYKGVGYINGHKYPNILKECYEKFGFKVVRAEEFFTDDKFSKSRRMTDSCYIVEGLKFVKKQHLLNEFQFVGGLLGNFGLLPEKNEVYFMPSDQLTQKFDLDNRPKVIIRSKSQLQKLLLRSFLSNKGEVEFGDLYGHVYGDPNDSYDNSSKLYNLISKFNKTMESFFLELESAGVNLDRLSISKNKNDKYNLILLNKEDTKNTSVCYLNYYCNGKI